MSQNLDDIDVTTDRAISVRVISAENTGAISLAEGLDHYIKQLSAAQDAAQIVRAFARCSESTGGFVEMRPEHYYIPEIIGNDKVSIPLYHFVEVLDEVIDYATMLRELPSLSYTQIGGAFSFLRKIAQCNPSNIDIDRLEDMQLSQDSVFLDELRKALADEETSRVLNID